MAASSPPTCGRGEDGAIRLLVGVDCPSWGQLGEECKAHTQKCTLVWNTEASILAIPSQKYTLGSAKNFGSTYNEEEHGHFLLFYEAKDVAKVQCSISCDSENRFWLHSPGYSETFLNGKLMETSPIRLRFGDIFYFNHILSSCWNPHLSSHKAHGLLLKHKDGQLSAVFKFERLLSKTRAKTKGPPEPLLPPTQSPQNNLHFLKKTNKTQQINPPPPLTSCLENGVILSKIFHHLTSSTSNNYEDLLNCRLVSKSWLHPATHTLKTHFVPKLGFVLDEFPSFPNKLFNRLHYFNERMAKLLPFENWKVDIWPKRYAAEWISQRDNPSRDEALFKFHQDFAPFLKQSFPIRKLDLNIDYLLPISQLLLRSCSTLEELTIQVNLLWIGDEDKVPFDEGIRFPALRTLRLQFSEGSEEELGSKLVDSAWLNGFLSAAANVEHLILRNYALLPIEFARFKRLKRVEIIGGCEYGIYQLKLKTCLDQLNHLCVNQLTSFSINVHSSGLEEGSDVPLARFLERQKSSLVRLDLVVGQSWGITLPKFMPYLKTLWISCDTEGDSVWGVRLQRHVSKLGTGFSNLNLSLLPMVGVGMGGGGKICDINENSSIKLDYGLWEKTSDEFVSYIPNVEKMWAWSR